MNKQYDDDIDRALRLFVVLTRCTGSVVEHSRRDIQRHKLTISEFGVLELLYHLGPTTLGMIADKILLTTGSITYVVDRLEQRGLVRRQACPEDRRVIRAVLTEEGTALMTRIFPEHAQVIRNVVSPLNAEEQQTLIELLKRLGLASQRALSSDNDLVDEPDQGSLS